MHESWVRVSQGGTTIQTDTPSRSDAQTVELEQSEASYGPMRQPPTSVRHEPQEGRSQEDIRRTEEEILSAPQGSRNYDMLNYQSDFIGHLDTLLGANRGAGRGSGRQRLIHFLPKASL